MQLFHLQFIEFEDLAIFAKNAREAQVLVDQYLSSNFVEGTRYQISHPIHFSHVSRLEFYQLQAALAINVQGRGVYDRGMGWTIEPLCQYALSSKSSLEQGISTTVSVTKPGSSFWCQTA